VWFWPDAAVSVLAASTIAGVVTGDDDYLEVMLALPLLVGGVFFAFELLRMGWVADLVPDPVLKGFGPKTPSSLFVHDGSMQIVGLASLADEGVAVVGEPEGGFFNFAIPSGERLDPDEKSLALGAANIGSGSSGGYVVTGGAVQDQRGTLLGRQISDRQPCRCGDCGALRHREDCKNPFLNLGRSPIAQNPGRICRASQHVSVRCREPTKRLVGSVQCDGAFASDERSDAPRGLGDRRLYFVDTIRIADDDHADAHVERAIQLVSRHVRREFTHQLEQRRNRPGRQVDLGADALGQHPG
jgi:hypothetical protein